MYLGCDAGVAAWVSSAKLDSSAPNNWSGRAFGGGGYFEAVYSFANGTNAFAKTDQLCYWANDIENFSGSSNYDLLGNWIELDIMEFDYATGAGGVGTAQATGYGRSFHNWYGIKDYNDRVDPASLIAPVISTDTWQDYNTYGLLWVPATATTQGYVSFYDNNKLVGGPIYWDHYSQSELASTAPDGGNKRPNFGGASDGGIEPYSGGAILDYRHLFPMFDSKTCMNVKSMTIWQATTANNITE